MDYLKESEWLSINIVLRELYSIESIQEYIVKVLKVFRMLIPYTKGYFIMLDENGEIDFDTAQTLGMEEDMFNNYLHSYFSKDYIKYTFEMSNYTTAYRDTDIINEDMRIKTEFYKEFLLPNATPFGCGIILIWETRVLGVVNLFRNNELGDFSDKDMFILNVMKDHMTNMVLRLRKEENVKALDLTELETMLTNKYGFTPRENEVAMKILSGESNEQIAEDMIISLSTVKKHVYNIFLKTGAKNRNYLAALIRDITPLM